AVIDLAVPHAHVVIVCDYEDHAIGTLASHPTDNVHALHLGAVAPHVAERMVKGVTETLQPGHLEAAGHVLARHGVALGARTTPLHCVGSELLEIHHEHGAVHQHIFPRLCKHQRAGPATGEAGCEGEDQYEWSHSLCVRLQVREALPCDFTDLCVHQGVVLTRTSSSGMPTGITFTSRCGAAVEIQAVNGLLPELSTRNASKLP